MAAALVFAGGLAWLSARPAVAVLRYPDGAFETRYPLHVDECGGLPLPGSVVEEDAEVASCLRRLRSHLIEDTDCNRVICDGINTSTPIEAYANESDWVPFKNLCGHLRQLFLQVFDLGLARVLQPSPAPGDGQDGDKALLGSYLKQVLDASQFWLGHSVAADDGPGAIANTTHAVLRRHLAEVSQLMETEGASVKLEAILGAAVAIARRLQLMIENISVTLLLNTIVRSWYLDDTPVQVIFHEIPGKRWDSLSFLLDQLGVSERPVAMAEIGVEAANTSQRLLERNDFLSYIGVDPYVRNDALYQDVLHRLTPFQAQGRFVLHRAESLVASGLVPDRSLDLVFLDARHDYEAVWSDMAAWHRKLRPGGILS